MAMENKRALLVEDVEIMQLAAKSMLVRHHFNVCLANDYASLEQILASNKAFDVILLDLGLPDIGIAELLDKIKASYPMLVSKIVVLTAHSDQATRQLCAEQGFNHYLVKPLTDKAIKELSTKL